MVDIVLINEIFQSASYTIGVHVTLLVVERAVWKTKSKFEEANLISFSEDGICLDGLAQLNPELANKVIQEFLKAYVETLGRLVGKQLALQIAEQLQNEHIFKSDNEVGKNAIGGIDK